MNLSDRINAAHKAHTGSETTRGARAWFARTLKVSTRTVTRWCNGTQAFDGPALASVEMLERMAAEIAGHEAQARRFESREDGDVFRATYHHARAAALRIP